MDNKSTSTTDLDAFLRAELAGVDLEGVRLEAIAVHYWRWGFQQRLRVIADLCDDGPSFPVSEDSP